MTSTSTTRDQILARIEPIIRSLFDEFAGAVTPALSARDVEQWDSLGHVQFVVMVEQEFGVRFQITEISELDNVGDLAKLVLEKQ